MTVLKIMSIVGNGFYVVWVLLKLYQWFWFDIFKYDLRYAHLFGIAITLNFITHKFQPEKDSCEFWNEMLGKAVVATICLCVGYIAQGYL
jgi:hypothetical protein